MLSVSIFNVARYLTDSLRGPVLAHYSEADRPTYKWKFIHDEIHLILTKQYRYKMVSAHLKD